MQAAKTFTWLATTTAVSVGVVAASTGDFWFACGSVGLTIVPVAVLYAVHERVWGLLPVSGIVQTIVKTATWRCISSGSICALMAIKSGNFLEVLATGLIDGALLTVLYFVHEIVWKRAPRPNGQPGGPSWMERFANYCIELFAPIRGGATGAFQWSQACERFDFFAGSLAPQWLSGAHPP